jgi:predicted DNA-binding transcriptional regulator AlpA
MSSLEQATTRKPLLTYEDLERIYGLKRGTAAALVSRGILPCIKLGPRSTRFDPDEIEKWIQQRRVPATDAASPTRGAL